MRRREFLRGAVVLPVAMSVRPDALPIKRASFEEVGDAVLMSLNLPALIRRYDRDALESIDSGFDTSLHFTLKLWQHGTRKLIGTRELLVRIRWDPWKQRYVVATREEGRWSKRTFSERDAAVAAAVKLDRVRVAAAAELARGEDGPYYFVTVLALRNPLDPPADFGGATRPQGRDLEWFGQLVNVLAGERPEAEETVHVRTNAFYLVSR
ncbi:MAG: DUF4390 domain-containing protein [Nannocystaceae bacterium]|nr:DUF4390 domain-containing protein [Deltaproteobacteria bacterium]MBP7292245.1 DUF4390 domain-containing protein [Nannocystaceae bacterium]